MKAIDYFFFFGLFVFFSFMLKSFHLLSLMISLEMITLYIFFFFSLQVGVYDFYLLLFFLSVMACESALGLVIFIFFNRELSKDYVFNLSVLKY